MHLLLRSWLLLPVLLLGPPVAGADKPEVVTVYKTPTCGCCTKWARHMEKAGFRVEMTNMDSVDAVKSANGVPPKLASCHTALVGGYVVEGHVPAADVRRLLKEKPDVLGLAVPGMPAGSPGMEAPVTPAYDVLLLRKGGNRPAVYATHGG